MNRVPKLWSLIRYVFSLKRNGLQVKNWPQHNAKHDKATRPSSVASKRFFLLRQFLQFFFFQVIGKFSIRLVPDMTPETVEEQVCKYLNELHEKRGSPNDIEWVDCHKIIEHQDVIWFVEGSWSTCHVAETLFFPWNVSCVTSEAEAGWSVLLYKAKGER